ncbi:uncharacterized protein LOC106534821 [Austrofundulus limnaeus]|uniref:Uncharacterized protein LOC106534821 n=1 Tax=Austrofundulus limnaeus TaxID=52670 RepID=A0A2I4D4A8_AUSLI|nr:PREDICTED: uncharacterized protein LOC106534821 [Austrofundulus limnaeus]
MSSLVTTNPSPVSSLYNITSNTVSTSSSSVSIAASDITTSNETSAFSAEDIIAANDIASRANYIYSFFGALGFLAGCFLLYSFIQTYRAHRRVAWLDSLLWVFCGFQELLLLLSLHMVVHRPKYMQSTALGCAALSFTINTASLCSLLVLLLMAYVLTFDPPPNALLRKPKNCATLVILTPALICLLLAGLRGLQENADCIMDPPGAGVSYAATKLCLAFLIPFILQLGLLISGCVQQWKSRGRFLSGSEEGPVFLAVSVVLFVCLLFYTVALVRGARLALDGDLSPRERAFLSVAECVLFSGSSVSLVLVLLMHRPCRESLYGMMRQTREWCQRPGSAQPNRNIIAPHIEITDTLQDIES